jgi:hypothetical protein
MLIRVLIEASGDYWELHEDEVLDVDARYAQDLISKGWAEPVAAEAAAVNPPEAAVRSNVPRTPRIRKSKR